MQRYSLIPHPATPPATASLKLWVNVDYAAGFGRDATLNMVFCVAAPATRFVLGESPDPARRDNLWQSTCFEAFLRPADSAAYDEWNFAPSGDWAAYSFTARRDGMARPEVAAPPYVRLEDNLTWWALGATIAVPFGPAYQLGLSAVLEEGDGTKSYWALAHPEGPPDFHDPACVTAVLPAIARQ